MSAPLRPECRARLERLFAYIDGELSAARARTLERHLAACECCAELQRDLRQVVLASRAAGATRLPQQVRRRARARIDSLLGRRRR